MPGNGDQKTPFDAKSFLAQVGTGRRKQTFEPHAPIYVQGDPAVAIYYLHKGKAKLTVTSTSGKEAVLSIIGPGDFFGEGSLNGHPLRLTSVTAETQCVVTRIEKATMMAVLHKEPDFSELFIAHLIHRNSRIQEDLVDQLFNSSEKRLARTLLLLANFGDDKAKEMVIAKMSQETLAEMIGTTRSRVNFFMNKFRRLGLIDYNGSIKVHASLLTMVLNDAEKSDRKSLSGGR